MPTVQHEIRYLTAEELTRLRRHAEARALQARERGAGGRLPAPRFASGGGEGFPETVTGESSLRNPVRGFHPVRGIRLGPCQFQPAGS